MKDLAVELPKMIQDPRYTFFDFETELNNSGKHLLDSGRKEAMGAALGIFSSITQLFPDSAITYKNMAETYLKLGDKNKAKELLKKTISLDPYGKIGKSAAAILKGLK